MGADSSHLRPSALHGRGVAAPLSMDDAAAQVVVIGGGLAGLSAAHTVLENGGAVVLIDKMKFLGGNSTRATSGINGAPARVPARRRLKCIALADKPRAQAR